jgi:energy-coupling factor transport system permease protein
VGRVLWEWWRITVTLTDLHVAAILVVRFLVLILGISLLSMVTTTAELTHGIEHLLRPLQRFGFPAHELALVVIIALRFVPLLALEAERLAKAQASRGADFGRGGGNVFKRARRMLPLMVTALRRAETLILAMEARCYTGGEGRTHLIHLEARRRDTVAVLLTLLLTVGLVMAARFQLDAQLWNWISK